MADELLAQLVGVNQQPSETMWGLGANSVASAIPSLVDPYGSTGGNFARILGAGLLSGLLGYQAKQAAKEYNLGLAPKLGNLMQATSYEDLAARLQQPGYEDLGGVGMQLLLKMQERKQAQEDAANAIALKVAEQQALMPGELQKLDAQNRAELEKTIVGTYGQPGHVFYAPFETATKTPEVVVGTMADDSPMVAASPTNAKEAFRWKTAAQIRQEEQDIEQKEKNRISAVNSVVQNFYNDRTVQNYKEVSALISAARKLLAEDFSKAGADTIKKLFTKTLDPTSTITLPEFRVNDQMQNLKDRLSGQMDAALAGKSDLGAQARADILNVIDIVEEAYGENFNRSADGVIEKLQTQNLLKSPKEVYTTPRYINRADRQKLVAITQGLEKIKDPKRIELLRNELTRIRGF